MTKLREVRVMRLKPGDVIMLQVEHRHIDRETIVDLKARLEEEFPGHRCVVLSGCDLSIVRDEDSEPRRMDDGPIESGDCCSWPT